MRGAIPLFFANHNLQGQFKMQTFIFSQTIMSMDNANYNIIIFLQTLFFHGNGRCNNPQCPFVMNLFFWWENEHIPQYLLELCIPFPFYAFPFHEIHKNVFLVYK